MSVNVGLLRPVNWKGKTVTTAIFKEPVADITRLYLRDEKDLEKMRRALLVDALPEGWRTYFAQQVEQPEK